MLLRMLKNELYGIKDYYIMLLRILIIKKKDEKFGRN